MYFKSKKISLLILGITSLVCSRMLFFLFNDPEGPNLLVVTGMALILFIVSLSVYVFKLSISALKSLLFAIIIQIVTAAAFYIIM